MLINSVILAITSKCKFKCRFNLNWILKLWIFIEVRQWSGGNQRIVCRSCFPSIIWMPISELGHQALVASVPTVRAISLTPESILYSLWGPDYHRWSVCISEWRFKFCPFPCVYQIPVFWGNAELFSFRFMI